MGCGKKLVEDEKVFVIEEIAKVRTNKSIAGRMNYCVITDIGNFGKIPQRENLSLMVVV